MAAARGTGRLRTAFAVSTGAGLLFLSPVFLHYALPEPLISTKQPLKPEAVRRGAFNNSGSRDCGPE